MKHLLIVLLFLISCKREQRKFCVVFEDKGYRTVTVPKSEKVKGDSVTCEYYPLVPNEFNKLKH